MGDTIKTAIRCVLIGVLFAFAAAFFGCSKRENATHTHVWGEWEITAPATCTEDGVKTRVCKTDASHVESKAVKAAHDFNEENVCKVCGYELPYTRSLSYSFNFNENCYSVSGIGSAEGDDIIIPDYYRGLPVRGIRYGAFEGCVNLKTVSLPATLQSIGGSAFSRCYNLSEIVIPDGVTALDDSVFNHCESLKTAAIGDGVTTLGKSLFRDCTSLRRVTVGDGVISIGDRAFENCSALTSIRVPDSVTWIGLQAFSSCTSLVSATIGDGVSSLSNVFYGCKSLAAVSFGGGLKSLAGNVFDGCKSLNVINFKGTYGEWSGLYSQYSAGTTTKNCSLVCSDGNYDIYVYVNY